MILHASLLFLSPPLAFPLAPRLFLTSTRRRRSRIKLSHSRAVSVHCLLSGPHYARAYVSIPLRLTTTGRPDVISRLQRRVGFTSAISLAPRLHLQVHRDIIIQSFSERCSLDVVKGNSAYSYIEDLDSSWRERRAYRLLL